MTRLALAWVVLALTSPGPLVARTAGGSSPMWEDAGERDPSFASFRRQLLAVAHERDTTALRSLVAEHVLVGSGETGIDAFLRRWEADRPESALWPTLVRSATSAATASEDGFCAPSYACSFPASLDPGLHAVLAGDVVTIRRLPDPDAPVMATVGRLVVPFGGAECTDSSDGTFIEDREGWARIVLPDGRWGFVAEADLHEPTDTRVEFRRAGDRWMIVAIGTP